MWYFNSIGTRLSGHSISIENVRFILKTTRSLEKLQYHDRYVNELKTDHQSLSSEALDYRIPGAVLELT